MADDIESTLNDWIERINRKTADVESHVDNSLIKAALFCEGEAKNNAMERIYNNPISDIYRYKSGSGKNGEFYYKRTGLSKEAISSGLNPDAEHSAIIYNSAPYAKVLEYGDSKGHVAKNILSDAVFNNKNNIMNIIKNYLSQVVK